VSGKTANVHEPGTNGGASIGRAGWRNRQNDLSPAGKEEVKVLINCVVPMVAPLPGNVMARSTLPVPVLFEMVNKPVLAVSFKNRSANVGHVGLVRSQLRAIRPSICVRSPSESLKFRC
jgi:hypothetical protein